MGAKIQQYKIHNKFSLNYFLYKKVQNVYAIFLYFKKKNYLCSRDYFLSTIKRWKIRIFAFVIELL